MLPAQTQELQPEMVPVQQTPTPTVYGFGKVLSSIQGLQQRLEDFSVEDVSRAETDAKNLIQQLSVLRSKLQCLAELQEFVVSANSRISEIPAENFEQAAPDGLENHPQLHAIVQASKLIRFHRIMKAAKAGAESISFDPEAGVLNIATSAVQDRLTEPLAEISLPPPEPEFSHLFDSPPEARSELTPTETGSASSEPIYAVEDHEWLFSTETESQSSHEAVTDQLFELAPADLQAPADPDPIGKSPSDKPAVRSDTQGIETKVSPASAADFDQRFLSDLIETYGEFTVTPNLPATIEATQAAKSETHEFQMVDAPVQLRRPAKKQSPKLQALSTPVTEQPKSEEHQTLPVPLTSPKPAESKAPELLAIPAPRTSESEPIEKEQRIPTVSKHGELDRQLKSIIKDYGEYDLYSHRSAINFKTAAIAAFAVLGLVLGGFYFFKVPAVPTPAAVSTIEQPSSLPDTAKTNAGARSANTSNSNKSK